VTFLSSFEVNLSSESEGTRMTTICLSEEIIAVLENLDEPHDFCDEAGHLLGSFIPEAVMPELLPIVAAEGVLEAAEEDLGPEICIYGFERDLE